MDYLSRMRRRIEGGDAFCGSQFDDKHVVRQFAQSIGVRTPEVHFRGPIDELPASLPDEFVIKPEFASTSVGVQLLELTRKGFRDVVKDRELTRPELIESCRAVARRFLGDDAGAGMFVVEEMLRDPEGNVPPADVRFYAFQGVIGMILMEHHIAGPARAMYFDGEFLPFHDVEHRYGIHERASSLESIEPAVTPENWRELLAVARRVSVAVPAAFVRVDLYDTDRGVVLGEITPTPGTFFYENRKLMSPAESARLGRLWEEAEERLAGSHDPRGRATVWPALRDGSGPDKDHAQGAEPAETRARELGLKASGAPLVHFRGEDETWDDLVGVPIKRFRSLDELDFDLDEPARYLVLDPRYSLPIDLYFLPRSRDRLLVGFHGAEQRSTTNLPKFQFLRSFVGRNESVLLASDSTLLQGEKMGLGWLAGNKDTPLADLMAAVVRRCGSQLGVQETVLIGHSGGGFAAVLVGSKVARSHAIAVNGQSVVRRYEPWTVRHLHQYAFPEIADEDDLFERYGDRLDLRIALKCREETSTFTWFGNTGDPASFSRLPHFQLLAEHFGLDERGGRTAHGDALVPCSWADPQVNPHAMPGTALPFLTLVLDEGEPVVPIGHDVDPRWIRKF